MKFLQDLTCTGKRVLIRVDFNVPLGDNHQISDDNRIKQALPTLKLVLDKGGRPVLVSHLGDPEEHRDPSCSLKQVAQRLQQLSGVDVKFVPDCVGPEVEAATRALEPGQILLLENLRYYPGEKSNDVQFSQQLSRLGDVFVNDAFATAHRKHASMVGVPQLFKEKAPGLLMQREMEYHQRSLIKPKPPLCIVLGGLKVSTKFSLLMHLAHKADKLIIGGAMANTFLAAQGIQMGRSKFEQDFYPKVLELLGTLARRECKVYLPVDFMVGRSPGEKGIARAVPAQEVPADLMALDIGPATSILYREALHTSETIVWNGPMGAFENEDFSKGTTDLIESIASSHAFKVVGGGDTDAAIRLMQLEHKFDFISTGGAAFLALMEGKGLPAFTALDG